MANLLGRPVLAEAGDQVSLEDEDRDLPHPLAHALGDVIELRFPFGDHRVTVGVDVQQLAADVGLVPDDLGFPVGPDRLPVRDLSGRHL